MRRDEGAKEPASRWRRRSSLAAFVTGGAGLVAASVLTGLAIHTKQQFDDTSLMHRATVLKEQYQRRTAASIACAGVAAVGVGLGFLLWPGAELHVAGDSSNATASLTLRH